MADVETPFRASNLSLKEEKEAFVSNLSGTSKLELFFLLALLPVTLWGFRELRSLAGGLNVPVKHGRAGLLSFFMEVTCSLLPLLLSCTLWADSVTSLCLLFMVVSSGLSALVSGLATSSFIEEGHAKRKRLLGKPKLGFVTSFRGAAMMYTCISILAVDFAIFPRRFAKTESFGTGLMDVGVGVFVFSGAICSRAARRKQRRTTFSDVMSTVKGSLPALLLGSVRLIVNKSIDYQEHVTEYGVHWNFFFTLFFTSVLFALLDFLSPLLTSMIAGVIYIVGYQCYLSLGGLQDFILEAPRDTLFSMNREGICQIAGFLSIYVIAANFARRMYREMDVLETEPVSSLQKSPQRKNSRTVDTHSADLRNAVDDNFVSSRKKLLSREMTADQLIPSRSINLLRRLFVVDGILWLCLFVAELGMGIECSRRMANLSYVLYTLAQSFFLLGALLLVDLVSVFPWPILIFQSVSRAQLQTFLLANVLTGIVNVSVDTLRTPSGQAFVILFVYILVVCMGAIGLSAKRPKRAAKGRKEQ